MWLLCLPSEFAPCTHFCSHGNNSTASCLNTRADYRSTCLQGGAVPGSQEGSSGGESGTAAAATVDYLGGDFIIDACYAGTPQKAGQLMRQVIWRHADEVGGSTLRLIWQYQTACMHA